MAVAEHAFSASNMPVVLSLEVTLTLKPHARGRLPWPHIRRLPAPSDPGIIDFMLRI